MPQVRSASAFTMPSGPIAIRLDGFTIGFAIYEKRCIRFLSGHWRFDALDGRRFEWLAEIFAAASRIAETDQLKSIVRPTVPIREREWELEEKV